MKISRAKLKQIFEPESRWFLTHCLLGPVNHEPREIVRSTSYGFILRKPDGKETHLRFEAGDTIMGGGIDSAITVLKGGEIAARYVPQPRFGCDQCQMLQINGTPCHETGCPNMGSRWDPIHGEWIKQYKCFTCGCTVDADDPCCSAEPDYEEASDGE